LDNQIAVESVAIIRDQFCELILDSIRVFALFASQSRGMPRVLPRAKA